MPVDWCGRGLARAVFARRLGLPSDPPAESDYSDAAVEVALRHRLGPMVWAEFGASAPPSAARRLAAADLQARDRAVRSRRLLWEVARLLEGVPYLVIKGIPLAERLHGDAALRPSSDVDLLLTHARAAEADRRFRSAGFGRIVEFERGGPAIHMRGADTIDVHFEPYGPELSFAGMLERAERHRVDGAEVPVPSDQDSLFLVADHYLKHLGDYLILLLDVLMLRRRIGERAGTGRESLALRDAARWLGIGPGAGAPKAGWGPVERYLKRVSPERRIGEDGGARRMALGLYARCRMRPSRFLVDMADAFWPTGLAERGIADPTGWRLRRLARFAAGLVGIG